MAEFTGFQLHPKKLWKCDCCFEVYSCGGINQNGGVCPSCSHDCFTSLADGIPLFVPDKAPKKKPIPNVKFEGGEIIGCE